MSKSHIIAAVSAAALFFSCAGAPAAKAPAEPATGAPAAAAPTAPKAAKAEAKSEAAKSAAQPEKKAVKFVTVRVPLETKSSVLFDDGSLDGYTLSERNAAGVLISQTRYTASGSAVEKIEYAYKDGLAASKTTKDGEGKVTSVRSYTYGPNGLLVAEALDDASGKRLSSFEYAYDAAGKRTSWVVKDSKSTPIAETAYAYESGRIAKAELKDGIGRKTGYSVYEYDGDKLAKISFFDAVGTLLRIETSAWKNGKLILEERKTAGGSVLQRTAYEYGADGELQKKMWEDVAGKSRLTTTYEYSFKEEQKTVND